MIRDNPCRKDCKKRQAYCRLSCPEWDEYVEKRDAKYNDPKRKAETDYSGAVVDRMERCRKRMHKKNKRMQ